MAKLLIPAIRKRGPRLPLTLATFLVPVIGLFVVLNIAPVRSPLNEAEATLALAARNHSAASNSLTLREAPITSASIATVRLARNLVGTSEFELRLLGLLLGAVVLSVLLRLGERLYSTRVGILAAILLFMIPAGRSLLGASLSVTPYYILATLLALRSIRVLAISRQAGLHAGLAIGVALALVGPRAFWLVGFAGIWLWRLRGLTLQSTITLLSTATLITFLTTAVCASILAWSDVFQPFWLLQKPWSMPQYQDFFNLGMSLIPLLPLAPGIIFGIQHRPRDWQWRGSPRFVALWVLGAFAEFLISGQGANLLVALCMSTTIPLIWAIENPPRSRRLILLLLTLSVAGTLLVRVPSDFSGQAEERWATREIGRFAKRTVPLDSVIRTDPDLKYGISYYARRQTIGSTNLNGPEIQQSPYWIGRRERLIPAGSSPIARVLPQQTHNLRILAEIGPFLITHAEPLPEPENLKDGATP